LTSFSKEFDFSAPIIQNGKKSKRAQYRSGGHAVRAERTLFGPAIRSARRNAFSWSFGFLDDVEVAFVCTEATLCHVISGRRARRDERQKYHHHLPRRIRDAARHILKNLRKLTDVEINASIDGDPDWDEKGWSEAVIVVPAERSRPSPFASTAMCLIYFKKQGTGYQKRIKCGAAAQLYERKPQG
jgi:hypothetical protein